MLKRRIYSGLWTLANARHEARFRRGLRNPDRTQAKILERFLRRNRGTAYGREHGYGDVSSVAEFQERVPIVDYEDLSPYVDRILAGERGVLTAEPVIAVERTSGSSGAVKYIPFTRSLLRELRAGVGAWMYDLFAACPRLRGGSQYWSLTPLASSAATTTTDIPLGFDDDLQYFGRLDRWLLSRLVEIPTGALGAGSVEECLRITVDHLLRCRDLRFISVWSPTLLELIADALPAGQHPRDVWPELELISCWTSAASAPLAERLRGRFPGVEMQGKGLLATEGIVTLPRRNQPAPVPALTSHFLEFVDADGVAHLADDLEVDATYSVLVTTGGGFARYRLGDQVVVPAPGCLEFIGREGNVSDLCGEKLDEAFVRDAVDVVLAGSPAELLLAPGSGEPSHYVLFGDGEEVHTIARRLERRLRRSYHYDYCRALGQLGPVRGVSVSGISRRYLAGCESLGQRAGDVKATVLRGESGWLERMTT